MRKMKALVFNIAMLTTVTCLSAQGATIESRARTILDLHAKEIQPLEKAVNLAWWDANVSGKDDDFKKKEEAQNKYDERLSDPELFAELKAVKSGLPQSADPILRRQIDLLYLQVLEKQVPSDLLDVEAEVHDLISLMPRRSARHPSPRSYLLTNV